ncbi:WD40 repeat [Dillenia turbinata]|uniref:WD40 repeat n=1 Tax=Dillenia turbinata TaxID=194707 RepID=A0AAN8ZQT6_9MAGN
MVTTCIRADTVRGLAVMPGLGILSSSHDGLNISLSLWSLVASAMSEVSVNIACVADKDMFCFSLISISIRLWAVSGEALMEMVGHTSIVYSVDSHISGLIVSGSEDCSAKIWKDGVCIQSIEHPGCVWDVKFLDNGDIITACSDGVVRIWTVHSDRVADLVELETFLSHLSQYKRSRKRVGGLKLEDLPALDALQIRGTSDGQTKVVREGDNGVAYAWNMSEQKWDKGFSLRHVISNYTRHIGEVVDGPDDGMKRPVLDGIEYDYVFDVDIGDGEPIRKLPYNKSVKTYRHRFSSASNAYYFFTFIRTTKCFVDLDMQYCLPVCAVIGSMLPLYPENPTSTWGSSRVVEDELVNPPIQIAMGNVTQILQYFSAYNTTSDKQYFFTFILTLLVRISPPATSDDLKAAVKTYKNPYSTADKWLLKENLPLSYRQQIVEFILQNSGQRDFNLDSSFRDPYTGCKYSFLQLHLNDDITRDNSLLFLEENVRNAQEVMEGFRFSYPQAISLISTLF